jgi:hypothetical protein
MSPSDVEVKYVNIAGNNLVVNTRSAVALTKAGIPQSEWNLVDVSADGEIVGDMLDRLTKNGLTVQGTKAIHFGGKFGIPFRIP